MKLLYDYQTFARQRYGGVSRYFSELIARVATMPDQEVALYMGLHINEYGLERLRPKLAKYSGVKHPFIPHTMRLREAMNRVFFSRFTAGIDPDVYHLTYFDDTPFIGKRRVVTVYDMIYERFPQYYSNNDPTPTEKRKAVTGADGIICISESTREDLINILGVSRDKTAVIYLANSLRISADGKNPVGQPYIMYVGKRGGYKNFDVLARSYAASPQLRKEYLLLCFSFDKVTMDEHRNLASLGISDRVRFLHGEDVLLARCYTHASVFVFPSIAEGFGIPPLEAMYYGCPVIASDVPSVKEIVGDAAMYFDPASPEDLAAKLALLLHDNTVRKGLVERGYVREAQFSWDKCAAETVKFYRQLF